MPEPKLLYLAGDRSGVGKSSVALGVLGGLLKEGYKPEDLAYIKPCTQCMSAQLVTKFCKWKGIEAVGVGPIAYYRGFTYTCIDQTDVDKTPENRLQRIKKAVDEVGIGKKFVLVDGVGYASVGSCCGISNAEVAAFLKCPVLLVSAMGVGNAIDMCNLNICYFEKHGASVIGCVFNTPSPPSGRHKYEKCEKYVPKYFDGKLKVYGFIQHMEQLAEETKNDANVCFLGPPDPEKLEPVPDPSDSEQKLCEKVIEWQCKFMKIADVVEDMNSFYGEFIQNLLLRLNRREGVFS